MITSQILKFADSLKTQESKYLNNEKLLFLQIKKIIQGCNMTKKNF